ncbi:hypothetical protein B0O80DRAFT_495890 [Mortierella sp. GBAus27b]|nr:hypothetical protein B0O80DRAFT_495890 [Mortierella sp. GBAus27b]
MALPDCFMAFADLSPQAILLWMSPSGYHLLGYEPDDIIGTPTYSILPPDDHADTREVHVEFIANDLIANQFVVQFLAKDGRKIHCALLACVCYDFSAAIIRVLDSDVDIERRDFERLKRHHRAFADNAWNQQAMEPEARVCLIINRFTRGLTVMYASSACEKVLHVDPDDITGKPILLFIRSDDLAPFVELVDLAKTTTTICQMRFWFQSPNTRDPIPCEAIVVGTSDGIFAVMRKCKPFVRKHFIESREQYEGGSQGSSISSRWTSSYGSTPVSEASASPPVLGCSGCGPNTPSPPRNAPKETLNRIRIVELDDERPSQRAESNDDCTAAPKALPFQELVVQDYHEEEDSFEDDDVDVVVRGVAISRLDDRNVSN